MNKSSLPTNQKDALGMLLQDHRQVQKLFKEFDKAKEPQEKETLAEEICASLKLHAQLEEELVYPMLRQADPEEFGDLVDEAVVEHASAKDLIAQIEGMKIGEELFDAKVTVLGEYVNHHITEEEEQVFPKVVEKKIDLRELGQRLAARREELSVAVGA